jgi:tetratricopeptide (TPR) repeat protein
MPKSKAEHKMVSQKKKGQTTPQRSKVFSWSPYGLTLLISLFLIVATLVVFWPVRDAEFINFDDDHYVTENLQVKAGLTLKSVGWAFTTTHASNWHPLTWISHMLDFEFYGLSPGGHHITNVLFHIANTVLLFLVLTRMTKNTWGSGFVAALFALHPFHVESVAWISERKDVLNTFFWMLTMWFYIHYVEQPRFDRYLWVFLSFGMGLLSKPMLVTLPFVLLLLDYWPLGRFRFRSSSDLQISQIQNSANTTHTNSVISGLVLEKVPLFILSVLSSIVTFIVQQKGGAVGTLEKYSLGDRMTNALASYVSYIEKMIWPHSFAIFYPYPGRFPLWQIIGASLLLVGVSVLAACTLRRRLYLAVGWLWYLGTLVPVVGVVQVGNQSMADRYTYIPLIGLFLMIAWGVSDLLERWRYRRAALAVLGGVVLSIFIVLTKLQVQHWKTSATLFEHALKVTEKNYVAHNNLALVLSRQGKIKEAMDHYTEALRIKPNYFISHYDLALLLAQQGKIADAIAHYKEVLRVRPDFPMAHIKLGNALARQGKIEEAIAHYNEAMRINPHDAEARYHMAVALAWHGKTEEAIKHYEDALRINPDYAYAHNNLAVLLTGQGKMEEAMGHYSKALRIKPDYADAHYNLGNILARQGKYGEAADHFAQVLRIKPDDAEVHYLLGFALSEQGKIEEAISHYTTALRIKPNFAEVHLSLGLAHLRTGSRDAAFGEYEILRRINPALANILSQKMK